MKIISFKHRGKQKVANVKYEYTHSYDELLATACGNILIAGGNKEKRLELISKGIYNMKSKLCEPIIIFGEGRELFTELEAIKCCGVIDELYECSEVSKDYDIFCGMTNTQISDFFIRLAYTKNAECIHELREYTDAFLAILAQCTDVSMASMLQLSRYSDAMIVSMAASKKLNKQRETIIANAECGMMFRKLLDELSEAFAAISEAEYETGLSIISAIDNGCVLYVDISGIDKNIACEYFAHVLWAASEKKFTLIFAECSMLCRLRFFDCISMIAKKSNISLVVAHNDVITLNNDDGFENFEKRIYLLPKNTSPLCLQLSLDKMFGRYYDIERSRAIGDRARLRYTNLCRDDIEEDMLYVPAVPAECVIDNEAVIKGHKGTEILIVRRF
ncbi:MAG: hypothetical protein IJ460_06100 [Clostridia bacterium]|nr:hypothetical protein [Clostridia bacterium]